MLIRWGCSPPYIFLHVFVCRHCLFNLTRDLNGFVQARQACFTLPTQTSVRNATALEKNSAVTTINLKFNSIGVEGAKALATALEKNRAVTTINLELNEIGVEEAFATALEKNRMTA